MIDYTSSVLFLDFCDNFDHSNKKLFVIMTQDDILQSTKTVIQGLEALKNEHGKILESMQSSTIDTNKVEEKSSLLRKSIDIIELGKFYL